MAIEDRIQQMLSELHTFREAQRTDASLFGGGPGGTSGGMDARITKLEASVAHAERDIGELRSDMKTVLMDIATLKENVRHLPTKPWMFTSLGTLLLAIGGLVALIVRFVPHV